MLLYHSTGTKNAKKIIKSGKILSYTYFSNDLEKSKYYGSMYGRYKTFVVDVKDENE